MKNILFVVDCSQSHISVGFVFGLPSHMKIAFEVKIYVNTELIASKIFSSEFKYSGEENEKQFVDKIMQNMINSSNLICSNSMHVCVHDALTTSSGDTVSYEFTPYVKEIFDLIKKHSQKKLEFI